MALLLVVAADDIGVPGAIGESLVVVVSGSAIVVLLGCCKPELWPLT